MVLDYYALREQPFGVTPDSEYLFLSDTHREALASLLYGIDSGCGFVALIAKPGLGKTTLLYYASNLLQEKARIVFLFQTVCTPSALLRAVLTGLGVRETRGNLVEMQLRLQEYLAEQYRLGKRVVVVIDEAQNLDDSVLELVRMLSNFETSREKLIQIILSGQPQLAEKIGSPELVQLRQRVSIFASLKPFSPEETALYIGHRLGTAGYGLDTPLFTEDALALIAEHSEGIPRNINNLCFNALSLGCALQRKMIDGDIVREVVADLDLERWQKKSSLAARPEEKDAHEAPAVLSAASASSMLAGWIPKLAAAMVVLLCLGGALFASHLWPTAAVQANRVMPPLTAVAPSSFSADQRPQSVAPAEAAEQADSVVPPLAAPAPSSSSADQKLQPLSPTSTIRLAHGRTVIGICIEKFGRCKPDLMREIHRLNPQLSDLDHIKSGQRLLIPIKQPSEASLAERSTP
jgi:general secretion pathway protein A